MNKRIRTSVVCVHEEKVLLVEMTDPSSGKVYLFPPGGKIEEGETLVEAALRETLEETGFAVEIEEKSLYESKYLFKWAGKTHDCTTYFFKAKLLSDMQRPFTPEEYQTGVVWLPIKEVKNTFSYHHEIRDAMLFLLNKRC